MYILFHIPTFLACIFITYLYGTCLAILQQGQVWDVGTFSASIYSSMGMSWNYIWLFMFCLLPLFNATLNPVLYYCRMQPFREYILVQVTGAGELLHRGRRGIAEFPLKIGKINM